MKFRGLVVTVLVVVTFALPVAAQTEAQKQDTETTRLNDTIKELRKAPVSITICELVSRYSKADELLAKMSDPSSAHSDLDAKPAEVEELKYIAARLLLQRVSLELRSDRLETEVCSHDPTFEWINWGNRYELIRAIRQLRRDNPEVTSGDLTIADNYDLEDAILEYAIKEAARFREAWKKDPSNSLNYGLTMLWRMLVEEGIVPSVLGLNAQETFEILETTGRKRFNSDQPVTTNRQQ